jgi:hypothetical protein
MTAFPLLCPPVCYNNNYSITPFFAQDRGTVLMIAAEKGASMETMQLLMDSGAKASINYRDLVALLCSHFAV